MQADAVRAVVAGATSYLDRSSRAANAPQLSGAGEREDRARSTGEDRGQPPTVNADPLMAQGEDIPIQGNEQAGPDPTVDQASPEAKVAKLPSSNNPMLLLGQGANARSSALRPRGQEQKRK
jgi:hypothetical protein